MFEEKKLSQIKIDLQPQKDHTEQREVTPAGPKYWAHCVLNSLSQGIVTVLIINHGIRDQWHIVHYQPEKTDGKNGEDQNLQFWNLMIRNFASLKENIASYNMKMFSSTDYFFKTWFYCTCIKIQFIFIYALHIMVTDNLIRVV